MQTKVQDPADQPRQHQVIQSPVQSVVNSPLAFEDYRDHAAQLKSVQASMVASSQQQNLQALQTKMNAGSSLTQLKSQRNCIGQFFQPGFVNAVQCMENNEGLLQGKFETGSGAAAQLTDALPPRPNNTGLSGDLNARVAVHGRKNITVLQRCIGEQDESGYWKTLSSFDRSIRLDSALSPEVGDGGALTVFLQNTGVFDHRVVCLEWYDGLSKKGTELTAHLVVPQFKGMEPAAVAWSQAKSFLSPMKDAAEIKTMSFRQEFSSLPHKTVSLNEGQKENKRNLILSEIGKVSDYSGLRADCKTWAEKVASEAVI